MSEHVGSITVTYALADDNTLFVSILPPFGEEETPVVKILRPNEYEGPVLEVVLGIATRYRDSNPNLKGAHIAWYDSAEDWWMDGDA